MQVRMRNGFQSVTWTAGFLLKSRVVGLRPWECAGPRRKSLLCPLTSPEQSQAHTEPARGLHHSWGQVEDVTSFLPDLILGLSYALAPLIYADAVCLPITVLRPQGSHWQRRGAAGDLTDSWQQGLFLSPIWPDRPLKAKGRESGDPLQQSKVRCTAALSVLYYFI